MTSLLPTVGFGVLCSAMAHSAPALRACERRSRCAVV